jgi:hypothetical protein
MTKENFALVCLWAITVIAGVALWRFWDPLPNKQIELLRADVLELRNQMYSIRQQEIDNPGIPSGSARESMTIGILEWQARLYEPHDPERAKLYRDQIPYHKKLKEISIDYETKSLRIRAGLPPE